MQALPKKMLTELRRPMSTILVDSIGKKISRIEIERFGYLFNLCHSWPCVSNKPGMDNLPADANPFGEIGARKTMRQP